MAVNKKVLKKAKTLPSRRDATRVDAVYEQILLAIVRGDLSAGMELKTTRLANQLDVSRTPVVQALQRLAADGIVALKMNMRAVVRPGAENWLVEIHEMRELLEPYAAEKSAGRLPAEQIARLEARAEAAKPHAKANWIQAAREFDLALHLAMAEHCGNFAIGEAIRKCWSYKRLSYIAMPERSEHLEQGYSEHVTLLNALKAGDGVTARATVLYHLRSAAKLRPAKTIV